jgi:hypothetical protein
MRKPSLGGALALLVAGALAAAAHAKPPDLPVDCKDTFTPTPTVGGQFLPDLGLSNNNYELPPPEDLPEDHAPVAIRGFFDGMPLPPNEMSYEVPPPALYFDSSESGLGTVSEAPADCCPCCCPVCRKVWAVLCYLFGGCAAADPAPPQSALPEPSAGAVPDTTEYVQKLLTARRMYRIGQRCLTKGDLDMAYNCFQEAHLLAPTSRYGRQAVTRMSEIDARKTQEGAAEEQEPRSGQDDEAAGRMDSARELYRVGERCRKHGDYAMAVNCYREVQLLCPGSACARLAGRRITQIEAERARDEAAEPQDGAAGCPRPSCPAGKKINKKPRLKVIEGRSAPAGGDRPQDDVSAQTLRLPLFVNPPARRLRIKQDYPKGSDE